MEYDPTDWRVTNSDGEPDDFRVIRWFGSAPSEVAVTVVALLPNGRVWKSATVSAGGSFSVDAGGPVKYESDIPVWRYR